MVTCNLWDPLPPGVLWVCPVNGRFRASFPVFTTGWVTSCSQESVISTRTWNGRIRTASYYFLKINRDSGAKASVRLAAPQTPWLARDLALSWGCSQKLPYCGLPAVLQRWVPNRGWSHCFCNHSQAVSRRYRFESVLVLKETGSPWPQTLLHIPPVQAPVQGTGCSCVGASPGESVHARGGSSSGAASHLQVTALHQPFSLLLWNSQGRKAGARQKERSKDHACCSQWNPV